MSLVEVEKKGEMVYFEEEAKVEEGRSLSRGESQEEVYICEPEQGVILGKNDEDDEAMKPYVFKFNELCVFTGYQRINEEGQ